MFDKILSQFCSARSTSSLCKIIRRGFALSKLKYIIAFLFIQKVLPIGGKSTCKKFSRLLSTENLHFFSTRRATAIKMDVLRYTCVSGALNLVAFHAGKNLLVAVFLIPSCVVVFTNASSYLGAVLLQRNFAFL